MVWQENSRIIVCLTNISEAKTVCLFFFHMFETNNRNKFCVFSHIILGLYCLAQLQLLLYIISNITIEKMCKVLAGP